MRYLYFQVVYQSVVEITMSKIREQLLKLFQIQGQVAENMDEEERMRDLSTAYGLLLHHSVGNGVELITEAQVHIVYYKFIHLFPVIHV